VTTIQDDLANKETPASSLVGGASWLLISKLVSFAITTALPLILTRKLTKTEYGYYKQLFLILTSAAALLPFGMNMSLYYFVPRAKSREEKGNIVAGVVIFYLLTTGIAAAAFIIRPGLLQELFHNSPLTGMAPLIGLTMVPYIVASLLEFVLIANGDSRLSGLAVILINVCRTLLILAAALIWGTIYAILWCVLIVAIAQSLWLFTYVSSRFGSFWKSFRWNILRKQIYYALPLGLAGLIWSLQVDVDNYFVNHYFDAAMFAIYANGCFDVPLVGMLGDSVGAVLIPRISALQAAGARDEIVSVTVKAIRGLAFAYAPLFFFIFITATQVITLLFSTKYLASVPIFRVNLLMILLAIVAVDPVVRAFQSQHLWMMRMNVLLLGVLMVTLYFGVTRLGLIGAVSCVILIQYTARSIFVWRISRLLEIRAADLRPLRDVLKTLLAAAAAGLCIVPLLQFVSKWGALASLSICGVAFCFVYLVSLVTLKVPSQAEIDMFKNWPRNFLKSRLRPAGVS
jgi:O-antigen/teichoic acid export membrane protein